MANGLAKKCGVLEHIFVNRVASFIMCFNVEFTVSARMFS